MATNHDCTGLIELKCLPFDFEIIGQHSECIAEDGYLLRLYDLADGRTGAQVFKPGDEPGPIRRVD